MVSYEDGTKRYNNSIKSYNVNFCWCQHSLIEDIMIRKVGYYQKHMRIQCEWRWNGLLIVSPLVILVGYVKKGVFKVIKKNE